jgi:hypothetical protein
MMAGGQAVEISPAVLEYRRADQRIEYDRLADALAQMLYCYTLPPDDAYAWTRILIWEARMLGLIPYAPES